jgi:hypothetical protein
MEEQYLGPYTKTLSHLCQMFDGEQDRKVLSKDLEREDCWWSVHT